MSDEDPPQALETAGQLLRELLASETEFQASFQVIGDDAEVPADVRRAFPGPTLTIRFAYGDFRDAEVLEVDGVLRLEFWAPFYSTLRGERFFSLPVERVLALQILGEPGSAASPSKPVPKPAPKARPFGVIRGGKT